MDFLEKDLEEIICNASQSELQDRGLPFGGKVYKQFKIGRYGIADIITVSRYSDKLLINVYELKNVEVTVNSFLQALNYAHGIDRYLEKRKFSFDYEICITLVGRKINKESAFVYLPDFMSNNFNIEGLFKIYLYDYDIDGITFKQVSGYRLKQEGF